VVLQIRVESEKFPLKRAPPGVADSSCEKIKELRKKRGEGTAKPPGASL
jgi:hypothetical protein